MADAVNRRAVQHGANCTVSELCSSIAAVVVMILVQ